MEDSCYKQESPPNGGDGRNATLFIQLPQCNFRPDSSTRCRRRWRFYDYDVRPECDVISGLVVEDIGLGLDVPVKFGFSTIRSNFSWDIHAAHFIATAKDERTNERRPTRPVMWSANDSGFRLDIERGDETVWFKDGSQSHRLWNSKLQTKAAVSMTRFLDLNHSNEI